MKHFLTWLSRRRFPYEPLITIRISRSNLANNLREFMKIAPEGRVAPVLKSNAYGHGLLEVAGILEAERHRLRQTVEKKGRIPFFIVDSYFEAVALRSAGIRTPLLIIGYTRPEIMVHSHLKDVAFTVTALETLETIAGFEPVLPHMRSRRIEVHLKIDTGMHRQGLLPEELDRVSHILDINPSVVLSGICSHLSDADNADPSFTESQIHRWNKIVHRLQDEYPSIEHIHVSNTEGHRFVKESHANLSRLGFGLYGLADGDAFMPHLDLKPVMSMETILTGVKKIKRDETVGYGNSFKAERDMVIATIPVGYYEGVDLRLSNNGRVLLSREHDPCPIIGRVSMNITTIDVSHVPDARIGMPVLVVSDRPEDPNSIVEIARRCGTIPYEIAVHIPGQLRRTVVD